MQVQFSVVSCPIYAGGRIVKIEGIRNNYAIRKGHLEHFDKFTNVAK